MRLSFAERDDAWSRRGEPARAVVGKRKAALRRAMQRLGRDAPNWSRGPFAGLTPTATTLWDSACLQTLENGIVQKDADADAASGSDREFPTIVATMPIRASQRRTVLTVVILLVIAAAIEAPFALVQLPRIEPFLPTLQTVICVADLITAVLLFAQYSVQPRPAILVLAGGYIAGGLFAFLQTLAFPGSYASGGV